MQAAAQPTKHTSTPLLGIGGGLFSCHLIAIAVALLTTLAIKTAALATAQRFGFDERYLAARAGRFGMRQPVRLERALALPLKEIEAVGPRFVNQRPQLCRRQLADQ